MYGSYRPAHGDPIVGHQRDSVASVSVRVPTQDIALSFTLEKTCNVDTLYDAVVEKLMLTREHHYLSLEKDAPLCPTATLGSLTSKECIFFVRAKSEAPLVSRLMFLTPAELKKLAKNLNSEDLTAVDMYQRNVLHASSQFCRANLKAILKKKQIDVNSVDQFGNTPLMYAARSADTQRINLLINAGATVNVSNKRGETALHFLCKNPSASEKHLRDIIQLFYRHGVHAFGRDQTGNTPAHTAVLYNSMYPVTYFVDNQFYQLDTKNSQGDTCLHLAVRSQDPARVKQLLDMGAPKYILNNDDELPLDIAHRLRLPQVIVLLNADLETRLMTSVWEAVKKNDMEACKQMNTRYRDREEEKETDRLAEDKRASQMLTSMSKRGYQSTADLYKDMPYHTILNLAALWAASRYHFEILDYLLNEKAINFHFQNSDGSLLFYLLCRNHPRTECELYPKILAKCVELGAPVNERNIDGNSPLHVAALTRNRKAIEFLLHNGCFPNTVNNKGLSELHLSLVDVHCVGTINQLLQAGSDPMYRLSNGMTAIDFAKVYSPPEAYTVLCSCEQKGVTRDVFQPNVALLTLVRGENLLSKDDNGLSDPFCILSHRLGGLVNKRTSETKFETLNPQWNEDFQFAIKMDNIFFRDITFDVFDWDDPDEEDGLQTNDFIGSATLVLNPLIKEEEVTLELRDQKGKAGTIVVKILFEELPSDAYKSLVDSTYTPFDPLDSVREMLKNYKTQSVGQAKASYGYRPKYPIMIIPGLASSALEAWESPKTAWIRERVWVDPFKIGKMAVAQKISTRITSKRSMKRKAKRTKNSRKETDSSVSSETDDEQVETLDSDQRMWLRHILTAPDGFSDPPGIKLRPVQGLAAVDYLSTHPLARKASYVFGHVLHELAMVGYTPKNLDAAPYDWRIPPEKLEERDCYYTQLRIKIETMRAVNKERVVLMAHSMGNRNVQYFLRWIVAQEEFGQAWVDKNIHAFFAMGPPFLGASKTVRAVVSGDCMGLEVFLTPEEGRQMARGSASLPWLFPMQEELLPDTVAHIKTSTTEGGSGTGWTPESCKKKKFRSSKKLNAEMLDVYEEMDVEKAVSTTSPISLEYLNTFYKKNPLYWGDRSSAADIPPILQPPPVENLWVLYGTNLNTEVSYYFKPHKTEKGRYVLDVASDKYSQQKIAGINPRGLRIAGGIGFETPQTFQANVRANKSGDGTVPYCSLSYAFKWQEMAENDDSLPLKHVRVTEIDGADHREMLNNPAVFEALINYVCEKPIG